MHFLTAVTTLAALLSTTSAAAVATPKCPGGEDGGYELYCCTSTLDGGNALIKSLAALAKYPLNENTVNCILPSPGLLDIFGKTPPSQCRGGLQCCKVPVLEQPLIAALYCKPPTWS